MKGVVITEKNKNQVFGRLMKFFSHKTFVMWHQFGGGMRKRPGHTVQLYDDYIVDVIKVRNVSYGRDTVNGEDCIRLVMSLIEHMLIKTGYEVWFLGNRIVMKAPEHWPDPTSKYSQPKYRQRYMVFQIAKGWSAAKPLHSIYDVDDDEDEDEEEELDD